MDDSDSKRLQVIELWNTTDLTMDAIGAQVDVTRQRVHQILVKERNSSSFAVFNGDEQRLRKKIQRRIAKTTPRSHVAVCAICLKEFRTQRAHRFCDECRPHSNQWYRLIRPERHEKHRLRVIQNNVRGDGKSKLIPSSTFNRLWDYYTEHGHLPRPNRNLYVFGKSTVYIKNTIGERRWDEIQRKLNLWYSDETRKI